MTWYQIFQTTEEHILGNRSNDKEQHQVAGLKQRDIDNDEFSNVQFEELPKKTKMVGYACNKMKMVCYACNII